MNGVQHVVQGDGGPEELGISQERHASEMLFENSNEGMVGEEMGRKAPPKSRKTRSSRSLSSQEGVKEGKENQRGSSVLC